MHDKHEACSPRPSPVAQVGISLHSNSMIYQFQQCRKACLQAYYVQEFMPGASNLYTSLNYVTHPLDLSHHWELLVPSLVACPARWQIADPQTPDWHRDCPKRERESKKEPTTNTNTHLAPSVLRSLALAFHVHEQPRRRTTRFAFNCLRRRQQTAGQAGPGLSCLPPLSEIATTCRHRCGLHLCVPVANHTKVPRPLARSTPPSLPPSLS